MSCTNRVLRHALVVIASTGLSVGCSAITETRTVESADTYVRWSQTMDHIPFVFHLADGRLEAFDDHGGPWASPGAQVEASDVDRVEVYVGHFAGPSDSLCAGQPQASLLATDAAGENVVSALCDKSRTVVAFSDHARPRVLAARKSYVAHVRHLLLNGIWKSVAQEPDPRPY